jgi:hypothetical protein
LEPADEPHFFTELPPDRADAAPEKPDFLSNVTSRARDRVPGGSDNLPRSEGDADAPTVKLERDRDAVPPTTPSPAAPTSPAPEGARAAESAQRKGSGEPGMTGTTDVRAAAPKSGRTPLVRVTGDDARPGSAGSSDIDQPEMANPDGNASLLGDVSLNTTAWDYAPWLQRFGRQLLERWYPPTAYSMGILKEGGWALFEVEISKSGRLLRLELLEEQGHPSLTRAAESALRMMAPIERLPEDFPEPTLILRIRMIYPKFRPR